MPPRPGRNPRNKFNAKRCEADGHMFDSLRERDRYLELCLLQEAGEIEQLEVHPKYVLHATVQYTQIPAKPAAVATYIADFRYYDLKAEETVVEDVKGGKATQTALSRHKIRHCEIEYGIKIRIV